MKAFIAVFVLCAACFALVALLGGPGLSGDEARCYNIASERAPAGKADPATFQNYYQACLARR